MVKLGDVLKKSEGGQRSALRKWPQSSTANHDDGEVASTPQVDSPGIGRSPHHVI